MSKVLPTVSTHELATRLDDPDHRVLDVRPIAAYNGWRLRDEPRGGHLPGVTHIPLAWTEYMDWVEVVEEKRLQPEDPVTIYGYDRQEAEAMAGKLERIGFSELSVYAGFLDEWVPAEERPLNRMERYRQLVHPEWLHALLEMYRGGSREGDRQGRSRAPRPPEYENDRFVLCHAHFDNRADYEKGHIPGAVPLDTNALESPETWNRRSPAELRETLERLGIDHETTAIVYGRFSHPSYEQERPGASAGHLGAMRCAAIMLYAGVGDVRVLNGGIHSWEAAGYELTTEETEPTPVEEFGAEIPGRPELMIDLAEAKEYLAAADAELVSVRSWAEFIGERSGYHYIEKKGRIPGAVFGNCGSDAYHMENYRNFDYTTRAYEEIAEKWAENGITPDKRLAFYCGTGWRGSEAFMNAYLMGWPRVAVYDGGWFEWSSQPDAEIATGVPEEGKEVA